MSKTIATILTLQDKMSGGLTKVSKNVGNMSAEMQRASKQSSNMVNKIGKSMTII
ncbi:hypothetical protein [Clostridium sp. FP1]|uniref:hypothetical protein n=1 Tax=Clostridium sp. FP1 TaxID=2724076 RepID=UPI0013E98BA4|nr:hypothetical protein [Clostridium sp. FP1]MBZ9633193.1 hypothetical protein [Clostridium sp. FP1]